MQALMDGTLDVASLLAEVPLTSLRDQLSDFRRNVSTGDVTSVQDITMFVAQLREAVEKIFDECDLDFSLIQNAFDDLLQDLINGKWFF